MGQTSTFGGGGATRGGRGRRRGRLSAATRRAAPVHARAHAVRVNSTISIKILLKGFPITTSPPTVTFERLKVFERALAHFIGVLLLKYYSPIFTHPPTHK